VRQRSSRVILRFIPQILSFFFHLEIISVFEEYTDNGC
jgi:hypothetical protein